MGQFQPIFEPGTVWLKGLVEAMDKVASSAARPSAADRKAFANRLELPAAAIPALGSLIHTANHRLGD
jgi:hypothetical protein